VRFSASPIPWRRRFCLGGREHHARRRLGFALADLDEIARADAGIGALEPVEAHHLEAFVLG
jgi:hypothetical protein